MWHGPERATDVAAPAESGAVHSEEGSLAAARPTACVGAGVGVEGAAPDGVGALKEEDALGDVGLDERNAACFTHKLDHLDHSSISQDLGSNIQ